jgi:hypothetical protein
MFNAGEIAVQTRASVVEAGLCCKNLLMTENSLAGELAMQLCANGILDD